MKRITPLFLLLAPMALAGCHAIKAHNPLRHKDPPYASAQQKQPLQVPPGMDVPPTNQALVIPNAGTGAASGTSVTVQPEAIAPPAAEVAPATAAAAAEGDSLLLSDTPDNAYQRVGRALANGNVGRVTAHDAEHTYQVAVDSPVAKRRRRSSHHLGNTQTDSATVTVRVTPRGHGSAVEVSGGPDAAARVFAALRERLK